MENYILKRKEGRKEGRKKETLKKNTQKIEAKWAEKTLWENCRSPVALLKFMFGCKCVHCDNMQEWMNQDVIDDWYNRS